MKESNPWEWGWQAVGAIFTAMSFFVLVILERQQLVVTNWLPILLVALVAAVLTVWAAWWRRKQQIAITEAEQLTTGHLQNPRIRENLLNIVQTAWIDAVLHKSIHGEIIKLYLTSKPDAVGRRPWALALKQTGQADQPLPADCDLSQLFAESGRSLLILGQPGSGKTFTLLQLAETLLTAARRDPAAPLPIILNLSSWVQDKRPLADWLVEELFIQYGLARHVARAGIAHNQFLYLLDGLDEVAAAVRDNCVTAVNAFKAEHPAEMVICSRSEEYAALKEQLRMGSAVEVQPLTPDQIDLYLNQDGLQLQAVRTTLKTDLDLGELAETPLMLSLMTLAYRGEDKIDLRPRAGKEARRRHIFDQYIARNFERRPLPANSPYTQEQAITWLANLARGMVEHGQSVFHIDLLQTTWLSQSPLNLRCIRFSNNLAAALSLALFIGWIYSFFLGWYIATVVIIVMVLIFGTILPLKRGLNDRVIRPTDQVVWHLPTRELLLEMSSSYKVALVGLLMVSVVAGVGATLEAGLYFGLSIGLLVFLVYSSFGFFFLGQSGGLIDDSSILPRYQMFFSKREITDHQYPNQRIHSSRRNGVKIALMIGILCAPLCYLLFGFVSGLFLSITAGLVLGLGYGGDASIRHYVLRWLLARAGVLPYPFRDSRLIAYLDSMQDRILLRRVGGGWMFVHRSLMEHFARMKEDDQKYATSFPRQSHGNHG